MQHTHNTHTHTFTRMHAHTHTGTLKEVAAAGVRGTDAAAVALIRAAARNNSLQLLDLRGVALGPEVRVRVCRMNLVQY